MSHELIYSVFVFVESALLVRKLGIVEISFHCRFSRSYSSIFPSKWKFYRSKKRFICVYKV